MVFIYSDRTTVSHISQWPVQLSLIALYLELDLDFLCASIMAPSPCHSWHNPAKYILLMVNLLA